MAKKPAGNPEAIRKTFERDLALQTDVANDLLKGLVAARAFNEGRRFVLEQADSILMVIKGYAQVSRNFVSGKYNNPKLYDRVPEDALMGFLEVSERLISRLYHPTDRDKFVLPAGNLPKFSTS